MKVAKDTICSCDELLFKRVREGDCQAYEQLYRKYQKRLLLFASRYTGDEFHSEEIVQEFFLQLWVKRSAIEIGRSLPAYLFRSIRNRVLNYFRDQHIHKKHLAIVQLNEVVIEDDLRVSVDRRDHERNIHLLVRRMPTKYREVFNLRILHRFSNELTARLLDRSVHTVDKQVRKITSMLRQQMHLN